MTCDFPLLLAAIRENPDDDTPRLVAADWLDEHDRPDRAEFIRCQVMLARASSQKCTCTLLSRVFGRCAGCRSSAALNGLRQRERAILAERHSVWVSGIPGAADHLRPDDLHRGFWEAVTAPGDWWVQHADALLAEHPIRRVRFASLPRVTRREDRPFYRFVNRPEMHTIPAGNNPDPEDVVCRLLTAEWPRIAFELPGPDVPLNLSAEQSAELNRRLAEQPVQDATGFIHTLLPILTPEQVESFRQNFPNRGGSTETQGGR